MSYLARITSAHLTDNGRMAYTSFRRRSAVIMLFVAVAAVVPSAQETTLQYRWNNGDHLKYRLTTQTDVLMSGIPGMGEMTVSTTQVQVQDLVVAAVGADGAATVNMKIESMKMDMVSPMGGSMSYDSTSPTPPSDPTIAQTAQVLGAIIGETLTVVIEPTGAVRSVSGVSAAKAKLDKAMASTGTTDQLGLGALLSDDAIKGALGQSLANFPKGPIKPGATWQQEVKVPTPMSTLISTSEYAFKGVEQLDGRQVARLATTIKTRAEGTGAMGPMTVKMEPGSGTGETLFDTQLGRVVRSTASTSMPMSMAMTAPDGTSISLQASTKTKVTYELLK